MKAAVLPIYAAFIGGALPERHAAFLSCIPQEEWDLIAQQGPFLQNPAEGIERKDQRFERLDPSWLEPELRKWPSNAQGIALAALPSSMQSPLKQALGWSQPLATLRPIATLYVRSQLFSAVAKGEKELIPTECLPPSRISQLARWKKKELEELITFLGLRELAFEMRQIIDTALLKRIAQTLSQTLQKVFKEVSASPETLGLGKGSLKQWDGTREGLLLWVEQKGINRLAKALFGMPPSLLWYVSRALSREQGLLLLKLCSAIANPKIKELLRQQVEERILL